MEVMALSVRLKEEGAATVKSAMDKLKQSVSSVQQSSLLTAGALGLLGRELIQIADNAQLLNARLRLVTDSQENLVGVQDELRRSADATRSSYEATVELYTRVARSTKNLGIAQSDLLRFTELTNMAIKSSGATSVEAANALIQLSQGLASGTLRGDEFRSVMEQVPGLATQIAAGLGVSVGELRNLAMQGNLTANAVVSAVLRMDGAIRKDFATIPMTVSDAFTVMRNNILFAVRDVNEALGGKGTTGLAGVLQTIGKEIVPAIAENLVAFLKGFELLAVDAAIAIQKVLGLIKREATQAKAFLKDMLTAGIIESGEAIAAAEAEYAALAAALEAYRKEQYDSILAGAEQTAGVIRETAETKKLAGAVRELNLASTERLNLSLLERRQQILREQRAAAARAEEAATNRALVGGADLVLPLPPAAKDLFGAMRNPVREEAAKLANEVQGAVADSIASGLEDGLTAGITAAIGTGRIADAFRAMGQAIVQNLASAMVKVALAAMKFGTLMENIRKFMVANPAVAVAAAATMLAFAYANGGKSQTAAMGVSGGIGGATFSPMIGGGATSDGTVTRLIFGNTSATTAAGMTPREATNVTIIGPDDPKAQRAIEELITKGRRRGTLG